MLYAYAKRMNVKYVERNRQTILWFIEFVFLTVKFQRRLGTIKIYLGCTHYRSAYREIRVLTADSFVVRFDGFSVIKYYGTPRTRVVTLY